jgi:stage V sporulation protein SpoVS
LGVYVDRTSTHLLSAGGAGMVQTMASRDVQVVDIDNDGDLDYYFSNHSTNGNQSNIWMINQGGAQGGVTGRYWVDNSRWVGVGAAGSSVPAAQAFASGFFAPGFVDWSCQCDFADVDLDGDEDLLHTSYGQNFNAGVMTRLYLNDFQGSGLGFFKEYNPSNAISANPNLGAGSQAGFVEGQQTGNTTNTTGTDHDITNESLDADFGDLDGDFDNDIFANSRNTRSRFYQSRFFENGGTLGSEGSGTRLYRDLTGSWGASITNADNNYDADINDMDNDNDIDGYWLNYSGSFSDGWSTNNGAGVMSALSAVPSSGADDNEIDWHDYDNDGDVDPVISAFSSTDKMYKNQFLESGSINLIQVSITSGAANRSLGADVGDMDNDGDTDVIYAQDAGVNEVLLRNTGGTPDPIAPRIPHTTQVVGGVTTSTPDRVVARAFDNVNFEYFKQATGVLNYTVDGVPKPARPAVYAGGNLFRATIPGYWYGNISYSISVTDRKGNTGSSSSKNYVNTLVGTSIYGTETAGCSGTQTIGVNSGPTINNPDFALTCTGSPANSLQLCIVTNVPGVGNDPYFLNFALWVDLFSATEVYGLNSYVDGSGLGIAPAPIPNVPAAIGANYYGQFINADAGCGQLIAASKGIQLTIQP